MASTILKLLGVRGQVPLGSSVKRIFTTPRQAKILVIDGVRLNVLKPLFNGESFEILFTRGEQINLSPRIIINSLLTAIREKTLRYAYGIAFIDLVNPSIVITFVDNNRFFQALDKRRNDDRVKFIAIQNGYRLFSGKKEAVAAAGGDLKSIYHSNFFCFGEHDVAQYKKGPANVTNYYPCGSLIDSYSRGLPRNRKSGLVSDICLIADKWNKFDYESGFGEYRKSYELLLDYLNIFQKRNKKQITVACKFPGGSSAHTHEVEWLQGHLGTDVDYVPSDREEKWTSYLFGDHAEVVVGGYSCLLREMFGRGKKILACNYSSDPSMEFPYDGLWTLKEKGYDRFEKRLIEIMNLGTTEYKVICGKYPSYLIGYSKVKPTQNVISEFIDSHIKSTKA
jgi:surface carbohydrate biosynthesis protein